MSNVLYNDHAQLVALQKKVAELEAKLDRYMQDRFGRDEEQIDTHSEDIAITEGAIEELYEMMLGGEE